MHVVRYPEKLLLKHVMFVGCVHACSNILNVRGNDKAPISPERVELFCLFVASTYTSMKATVLSCSYSWV